MTRKEAHALLADETRRNAASRREITEALIATGDIQRRQEAPQVWTVWRQMKATRTLQ